MGFEIALGRKGSFDVSESGCYTLTKSHLDYSSD